MMLKYKTLSFFLFGLLVLMLLNSGIPLSLAFDPTLKEQSFDVEFEDVSVQEQQGVIGECTVQRLNPYTVCVNLGTLSMPGSYAVLGVTIENAGSLTAYLTDEQKLETGVEDIHIYFPQLNDGQEKILPGEKCHFEMLISWDKDSQRSHAQNEHAEFSLSLRYKDGKVMLAPDVDLPDTGSASELFVLMLALMCCGVLILYVFLTNHTKRLKKRNGQ